MTFIQTVQKVTMCKKKKISNTSNRQTESVS